MPEISDAVSEAVEKGRESKLNTIVAMCVAIIATFMALCNVKAGNVIQSMSRAQANSVDQWSYYQSKSTKEIIAQAAADQATLDRDVGANMTPEQKQKLDDAIKKQTDAANRYAKEKEDIKAAATGFEKQVDVLDNRNDQFDMAEALLSVAIALLGVTALTQKRYMLGVAGVFGIFGFIMGIAGFARLPIHPDWLANILT
jgi:hypothetical protein